MKLDAEERRIADALVEEIVKDPEKTAYELVGLRAAVDQLRVQLAGCSTAALGWIRDPAKRGDYGWSVAYQDVLILRRNYDALRIKESAR